MQKIWYWLVYSSTNADKISLTVKGVITTGVAIVANIILLGHLQLDPIIVASTGTSLVTVFQAMLGVITAIVALVSAIIGAIGFVRKLYLSFTGQNSVTS